MSLDSILAIVSFLCKVLPSNIAEHVNTRGYNVSLKEMGVGIILLKEGNATFHCLNHYHIEWDSYSSSKKASNGRESL